MGVELFLSTQSVPPSECTDQVRMTSTQSRHYQLHQQVYKLVISLTALYYCSDKAKHRDATTQESKRYTWEWNWFFINLQSATLNVHTQ